MADTRREVLLEAVKSSFASITDTAPVGDPYAFAWSTVERGPLGDDSFKKAYALGIVDPKETKKPYAGLVDCNLTVVLEFMARVQPDDDPSKVGNMILGQIQRRLMEDPSFGGVAIDVQEQGNEMYVEHGKDRMVQGAVFLDAHYRYRQGDPRVVS